MARSFAVGLRAIVGSAASRLVQMSPPAIETVSPGSPMRRLM